MKSTHNFVPSGRFSEGTRGAASGDRLPCKCATTFPGATDGTKLNFPHFFFNEVGGTGTTDVQGLQVLPVFIGELAFYQMLTAVSPMISPSSRTTSRARPRRLPIRFSIAHSLLMRARAPHAWASGAPDGRALSFSILRNCALFLVSVTELSPASPHPPPVRSIHRPRLCPRIRAPAPPRRAFHS